MGEKDQKKKQIASEKMGGKITRIRDGRNQRGGRDAKANNAKKREGRDGHASLKAFPLQKEGTPGNGREDKEGKGNVKKIEAGDPCHGNF